MTAKEKALQLVESFEPYADYYSCDEFNQRQRMRINAVTIALISVDEIIEECFNWSGGWHTKRFDYWAEVKQEIKQL